MQRGRRIGVARGPGALRATGGAPGLAAGVAAGLALLAAACAPAPEIRNVVLVSLDAVGAKHVSAYGYPRETTPHFDAVAREGVLFESAYTQQTWTLTSHLTMLTGLAPQVHGATAERAASPAATPLALLLRDRGFTTAAFTGTGTWMHPRFGLDRGFDLYEMGGKDSRKNTPAIVAWLEEQARQQESDPEARFFLFVHYYDAHSDGGTRVPYFVPPPFGNRWIPEGARWGRKGATGLLIQLRQSGTATPRDLEFLNAYYDAGVSYVDEFGVGALVSALEEFGLADDTLLVITSDHGEEIFEHGYVLHGQPHQETSRVPLVFRGPGIPAGRRVDGLASLVDLAPTFLSLLGIPPPAHMQGRDLTPLLRKGEPVQAEVYVDGGHAPPNRSAVIADLDGRRWSYLVPIESEGPELRRRFFAPELGQLYALDEDPEETRNLAGQEREVARRLAQKLLDWYEDNEALAASLARGGESGGFDPEEQRRLEALGYAE